MSNFESVTVVCLACWVVLRIVLADRRGRAVTETRHWSYCPRCAWPRPGEDMPSADPPTYVNLSGVSVPKPMATGGVQGVSRVETCLCGPPDRPAQECIAACCQCEPCKPVLPSDLLKRGWSRYVSEDANGDLIPSNHPHARRWTVYGAGFGAFGEGSVRSRAFCRFLTEIIRQRYGGMSVGAWHSQSTRTPYEVIGVALEAERRMSAENLTSDDGDDPPQCRANQR